MDKQPTTPERQEVKTPVPQHPPHPHITTIREVKGFHVLDHKDDAIHPGPTGTREQSRSPTSL